MVKKQPKTEKITTHSRTKALQRQSEVLEAIAEMHAAGEKITFYSVIQKTGASKSYLYGNETIRKTIEAARTGNPLASDPTSLSSSNPIITALTERNIVLEEENKRLRALLNLDEQSNE